MGWYRLLTFVVVFLTVVVLGKSEAQAENKPTLAKKILESTRPVEISATNLGHCQSPLFGPKAERIAYLRRNKEDLGIYVVSLEEDTIKEIRYKPCTVDPSGKCLVRKAELQAKKPKATFGSFRKRKKNTVCSDFSWTAKGYIYSCNTDRGFRIYEGYIPTGIAALDPLYPSHLSVEMQMKGIKVAGQNFGDASQPSKHKDGRAAVVNYLHRSKAKKDQVSGAKIWVRENKYRPFNRLTATNASVNEFGPAWSQTGRYLAYQMHSSDGAGVIVIREWNEKKSKLVAKIEGRRLKKKKNQDLQTIEEVLAPSWSPDEQWLSYLVSTSDGAPYKLRLYNLKTKKSMDVANNVYSVAAYPATWTPDSHHVVYASANLRKGGPLIAYSPITRKYSKLDSRTVVNSEPNVTSIDGQWVVTYCALRRSSDKESNWRKLYVWSLKNLQSKTKSRKSKKKERKK